VFLVFLIAGRLAGEGAALRAAWMAALFPALVLYSVVVMREAMTVLALIAGAHFAVDWWRRSRWWSLVAAAACLLVGSLLHSGVMAALLALGLVAGFRILRPTAHGLRATVGGLAVIALVIGLVVGTGVGLEKLTNASNGISVQTIADNQTLAARGNTAYLSGFVPKRWVDLVWQTPVRMVYFLYGPLVLLSPLRNIGYVLLLFDGLLYVAMSIAIARRWRTIRATPGAPLLAFMAICLIGIFAIGVSNFGTAFRHRQKIAALLIPLVALPRSPTAEATGSASATSSAG